MCLSHSQSKISTGLTAGHLRRGMVLEAVWLAPIKSAKHMGYKNTTMDMETSTWQLCKKCLILAKGKSLKFEPVALQDSGDSVGVI